ncbi:unnamed protein product [Cylicostephanus goldi]|uniref:Uncharacterized protein n=1 Tax=Cylicostephanus goldi TaxID=71465 RepID=A0A3P7QC04_CYLGO|nr:unnamed protein product [Cylicostephanus goldi]
MFHCIIIFKITFFISTGFARSYWGRFVDLFGNEVESNGEQNFVSLKDEDYRIRYEEQDSYNYSAYDEDNSIHSEDGTRYETKYIDENNENGDDDNSIPYPNKNRYETNYREGDPIDNRVGYIFRTNHDFRTEEGYKAGMKELEEWIYNFSHQDDIYASGRETGLLNFNVIHEELR